MATVLTTDASATRMPLFALGFRPFYLLAAVFAVIAMILWIAAISGMVSVPDGVDIVDLHVHEFVFGFGSAVLAGFLLTAARSWSGRLTAHGTGLAVLVALWFAGRIAMITASGPIAAFVDALFLPSLALVIAVPIVRSGKFTHLRVVGLVMLLALANIGYHLQRHGALSVDRSTPALIAIGAWILLVSVIGGRVVPTFLDNARGVPLARRPAILEAAVYAVTASGFVAVVAGHNTASVPLLLVASGLHIARLVVWHPQRARGEPLLWVLPLAYAWIPVGLTLLALAERGVVPTVAAIHALTIGAMTTMMLAIMTRSSLGHTGRPLRATRVDTAIYLLITIAAVARVAASLVADGSIPTMLAGAGWIAAFALFTARYAPMFLRQRADGKPADA